MNDFQHCSFATCLLNKTCTEGKCQIRISFHFHHHHCFHINFNLESLRLRAISITQKKPRAPTPKKVAVADRYSFLVASLTRC